MNNFTLAVAVSPEFGMIHAQPALEARVLVIEGRLNQMQQVQVEMQQAQVEMQQAQVEMQQVQVEMQQVQVEMQQVQVGLQTQLNDFRNEVQANFNNITGILNQLLNAHQQPHDH
jgi:3-isopropylmalate dehydratase small subunit